uniref:Uncharacterized protein n=1 Tax=Arundo donax TaxID=35708 RepID=A0A0A9HHS8_ARUDO
MQSCLPRFTIHSAFEKKSFTIHCEK